MKISKEEAIDDIFENFQWDKVSKTMQALDWTWVDSDNKPPTIGMLIKCAKHLLNTAYDYAEKDRVDSIASTGGFCARAYVDKNTKEVNELRLTFEVTGWEHYNHS